MARKSLERIRGFLVDLDGTVHIGGRLIPGADDFYRTVREQGKRIMFLTNNASRTPEHCLRMLHAIGIPAERDELFTCAEATVIYLRQHGCRTVYPLATSEVRSMLTAAGLELAEHNPDWVLLAYDTDFTFDRLRTACRLLNAGAKFAVTNPDLVHPSAEGPVPHTGSLLAALTAATGRQPDVIVGKPNPLMLEFAAERLRLPNSALAVVGDQLSTDIALAAETELTSVLVMTGVAGPQEAENSPYPIDYRFSSIADIIPLLTQHCAKEA